MTTTELNRTLQIEMESLFNNEGLAIQVLNYIKKEKSQYEDQFISNQELMSGIKAGLEDVKAGKGMSMDEFLQEMSNEDNA